MPLEHQIRLSGMRRARRRRQPALDRAGARAGWGEGEAHECGLRHLSGGDGWSPMAALLWWMLRSGRADRS